MKNLANTQLLFKLLLVVQAVGLLIYTLYVGSTEGWNFFHVAITNSFALDWNGQFGLDFSCYLLLSGIWIVWRNRYSPKSIAIAIAAMVGGIIVFASYLLYLLQKEHGDIKKVILGDQI